MPLPIPNLDDKTFQELFEEARSLIPRYAPEWTDHNLHDPGITFIDLFAWLAEMQIYYLNRLPEQNYLKFLALLGERPQPAQSAAATVTFTLPDENNAPATIPAGTQVTALNPDNADNIIFETTEDLPVSTLELRKILTFSENHWHENTKQNLKSGSVFPALGNNPTATDKLYLGFSASPPWPEGELKIAAFTAPDHKLNKLKTNLEDRIPSLKWEHWNEQSWQILAVHDETAAFLKNGYFSFVAPNNVEEIPIELTGAKSCFSEALYWLRVGIESGAYEVPPELDMLRVNTIPAIQRNTIADEFAASTGLPFQAIEIRHKPILANTVKIQILEPDNEWREWLEVNDFDGSGPESRHFIVDSQAGFLKFGNDIRGHIPPVNPTETLNIHIVSYQAGGGEIGNVPAKKIKFILNSPIADLEVSNELPATGGTEMETVRETKSRIRRDFKKPTRGITSADFEALIQQIPGESIARVEVLPEFHPDFPTVRMPGAVTVIIVPGEITDPDTALPVPSPGLLQAVRQHLKNKILVTTNLQVAGPHFVAVGVTAKIKINPRTGPEKVRGDIIEALNNFLNPLKGGPDGTGWSLGRSVYKSEIVRTIQEISGVNCVDSVTLTARGCQPEASKITLPKTGLVYSSVHRISLSRQEQNSLTQTSWN